MKSHELRIGNYVSTPSGIQEVIHIEEDCFYTKDYKNKWAEIKPITLNDYWLEKFGMHMPINEGIYSADEAKYDGWVFGFCKVQQTLIDANYTWDCFDFYQDSNGFWFPFLNTHTNVNYVHEFQNLYFALTGNELKLASDSAQL
ncbi:hypothetical protein [Mesonia sp. HuA40]|uniref:hypothetical protein n=1 Tax=Mesonia sp. HuA40 TaxID=2602761 RepID=UPI0011CB15AA|nr:hypothetical protein [Mesonia sp. HuA40]TXK73934.1 hypothetical protein FT993_03485 [Mesonia sp. HuA40]